MTRKLILAAAVASSVLSGGLALAQSRPQGAPPAASRGDVSPASSGRPRGLMRADANGDRVITRQEMIAEATRRFDRLDRNRDGRLDATEVDRHGSRRDRGSRGRGGDRSSSSAYDE